jgi:hypothetical protein
MVEQINVVVRQPHSAFEVLNSLFTAQPQASGFCAGRRLRLGGKRKCCQYVLRRLNGTN